jgi:glyoxylase-like metal-dependent hydrolase (beta-lactamase superfamily II)
VQAILKNSAFGNYRHGVFPELLPDDFDQRFVGLRKATVFPSALCLPAGFDVLGDGSVITVPLPGHMISHFGFFFPQAERPFLYATDTQWLHQAVMEDRLTGPPASIVTADMAAARTSAATLRAFAKAGGTFVLCYEPSPTQWDL